MSTLAEISVPTDDNPPTEVDILIVGAGPAGLYGAYYAGFRGLRVAVMDVLPQPGGQITAMYPEKPIYDIAGLPSVRGRDLVDNLLAQAAPYGPEYLLGHQAVELSYDAGPSSAAPRARPYAPGRSSSPAGSGRSPRGRCPPRVSSTGGGSSTSCGGSPTTPTRTS
ncbi:hypothetical protein GCM10029978_041470 [Actinoallomurus acanthiterrae]